MFVYLNKLISWLVDYSRMLRWYLENTEPGSRLIKPASRIYSTLETKNLPWVQLLDSIKNLEVKTFVLVNHLFVSFLQGLNYFLSLTSTEFWYWRFALFRTKVLASGLVNVSWTEFLFNKSYRETQKTAKLKTTLEQFYFIQNCGSKRFFFKDGKIFRV